MTFTLHLPLELEQHLMQEARRQDLLIDAYTMQLLDKHLPHKNHRSQALSAGVEGGDLMSQVVLLNAGPRGSITNPQRSPQSLACTQWLQSLVVGGTRVIVPEIADYE